MEIFKKRKTANEGQVCNKTIEPHICVCRACNGAGSTDKGVCPQCEGSGRVVVTSEVTTYVKPFKAGK